MKWYKLGSFPILKSSGCRVVNFGRLKRTRTEIPCTVQRRGEREPAANRTTGRTGAAQPGLSWNTGREGTQILASLYFYSSVREGEPVPVAKLAFRAAGTAFLPRPGAGTNPSGSPASTPNAARGAGETESGLRGRGGDTNLWSSVRVPRKTGVSVTHFQRSNSSSVM